MFCSFGPMVPYAHSTCLRVSVIYVYDTQYLSMLAERQPTHVSLNQTLRCMIILNTVNDQIESCYMINLSGAGTAGCECAALSSCA